MKIIRDREGITTIKVGGIDLVLLTRGMYQSILTRLERLEKNIQAK